MIPSEKEISPLEHYFLNQEQLLLGLKWIRQGKGWEQVLITVDKREVSCLSLFLSIFQLGHFKQSTLSLKSVRTFLAGYQWLEIKKENPLFYKNICYFAHRQIKSGNLSLLYSVSIKTHNVYDHPWNCHLKVADLIGLEKRRNGHHIDFKIRLKEKELGSDEVLSETEMQEIKVGFSPFFLAISSRDHDSDNISKLRTDSTFFTPSPPYICF